MNRIQRAVTEARVISVEPDIVDEALALAEERLREGHSRSWSSARDSAARTVAARHETMPGPILLAMGSRGVEP